MMNDWFAVIVAGGKGSRMGAELPKQFIRLEGKPIIIYTLENFRNFLNDSNIFIVLPEQWKSYWDNLAEEFDLKQIKTVSGGDMRFDSVKNGLLAIEGTDSSIVAIHDAVRPFTNLSVIKNSYEVAEKEGCAITCVKLKDSIREIDQKGRNRAVNRDHYRAIQTPQTFNWKLIKSAFEKADRNDFSDDASVLEEYGGKVTLIDGNYENIKITTPEDLEFATGIIKKSRLDRD